MAITESKLKKGTLTLDKTDFATQATNVVLSAQYKDDGEAVETLSGDTLTVGKKRTETLKIKAIQDFTDPKGFNAFCWDNDRRTVDFVWTPAGVNGPKFEGKCEILRMDTGGDVNTRLSADIEFPINGEVTRTATPADELAIADEY